MSNLRPLGSEKLQGLDKIKRIIEIANYSNNPNVNEHTSEYSKVLADGNMYHIVKERNGYIIKSSVNENSVDYREPIQERKYFDSYSQALKRLNIIAKELNENYGNEDGVSLFSEDKKFFLKQKKNSNPVETLPEVENIPPPAPEPMAPPAPAPMDTPPMDDPMAMGDSPMPGDDMPVDDEMPIDDEPIDLGMEPEGDDEESHAPGSFRLVQKLLGKMTQKMRDLADEDRLTDKNIKYVINTVLAAVDLSKLSQDDKDDIMAKFEEEDVEDMDMDDNEPTNTEDDIIPNEEPIEEPTSEMGEGSWPELASRTATNSIGQMMKKRMGYSPNQSVQDIMDGVFTESKVDKILTKYFKKKGSENTFLNEQNLRKENELISELQRLSETTKQFEVSKRLTENVKGLKFVGKTNKQNLVFEKNNKQYRVSIEGKING
jgi:hypothetical protein